MALTNVFEVASDKLQLDHPVCVDCNRAIFQELGHRIDQADADFRAFTNALTSMGNNQESDTVEPQVSEEQERKLEAQLARLRAEREVQTRELSALAEENEALEILEERYQHFCPFSLLFEASSTSVACAGFGMTTKTSSSS
jgi:beclin 1